MHRFRGHEIGYRRDRSGCGRPPILERGTRPGRARRLRGASDSGGGADYVPPAERIAVFDNDGTLWCEQPLYTQLAFAMDRVRAMAAEHPEWSSTEPFASILAGDSGGALSGGEHALLEIVMATHAGMTTEEFEGIVTAWMDSASHPAAKRKYTDMVYAPMVELLDYLGNHGFKTYIVSGGGVEFMLPWTEAVYGIPPEQVIGSSIRTKYEAGDGKPAIKRLPEIDFIDDKAGKPVGIHKFIGRLARGLDEAESRGWTVVSMKADWNRVFAYEK